MPDLQSVTPRKVHLRSQLWRGPQPHTVPQRAGCWVPDCRLAAGCVFGTGCEYHRLNRGYIGWPCPWRMRADDLDAPGFAVAEDLSDRNRCVARHHLSEKPFLIVNGTDGGSFGGNLDGEARDCRHDRLYCFDVPRNAKTVPAIIVAHMQMHRGSARGCAFRGSARQFGRRNRQRRMISLGAPRSIRSNHYKYRLRQEAPPEICSSFRTSVRFIPVWKARPWFCPKGSSRCVLRLFIDNARITPLQYHGGHTATQGQGEDQHTHHDKCRADGPLEKNEIVAVGNQ